MKSRLVLLGAPASGKGTQSGLITATFGIPSVSTGALMREEGRRGTDLGKEAARYTTNGGLFPDDLAMRIVWSWLGGRRRFLFDGFPRTLAQAKAFDAGLSERGLALDAVYLLELPEEEIHARMLSRLTCRQCGAVFNEAFHSVSVDTPCPSCSGPLHRRDDDTEEALKLRMAQYREQTVPVADHYREAGLLMAIDATPGRDSVFARLYSDIREENP